MHRALRLIPPAGVLLAPAVAAASGGGSALGAHLPLWSVLPFAGLLACIAILPLVAEHWWESNLHKAFVALGFGLPTACYVLMYEPMAIAHSLHEYAAFIALLGALFIISGGLVLRGDIRPSPAVNTGFLAIGALLANIVGTTGASMVLIRPLLRANAGRRARSHVAVFFIFVVANMGGMLTPLGDPPLFLGYLRGVPFFWTLRLLPIWALGVGVVLAVFFLVDRRAFRREPGLPVSGGADTRAPVSLVGVVNIPLLGAVLAAVFLPSPWREAGMVAAAAVSVGLTPRALRTENGFTYHPIIEVAVLFIGIFLAMVPALAILEARGGEFGLAHPWQFFWTTGALSSVLDNAPTYLSFLALAQGLHLQADVVGVPTIMLEAISAGAVFMGANSYIGNGPNFMVKAIAEENKVPMPSFFGYMAWAAVFLWPVFLVVTLVFFR